MQDLLKTFAFSLEEELDIKNASFTQEDAPNMRLETVDIRDCTFTRCDLTGCRFQGTGFERVAFSHCDLSGATFLEGGLKQVTFQECRMTGAAFSGLHSKRCGVLRMQRPVSEPLRLHSETVWIPGWQLYGKRFFRLQMPKDHSFSLRPDPVQLCRHGYERL